MEDLDNLEKLNRLRDKEIITDSEFESIKKSLISNHLNIHIGAHSGVAYAMLAWFLGIFGAHNFYAGYTKRALVQILITLFSGILLFIPAVFVQIWALGDMYLINEDAENVPFYGDKTLIRIIRIAAVAMFILMYFFIFLGLFTGIYYSDTAVITMS